MLKRTRKGAEKKKKGREKGHPNENDQSKIPQGQAEEKKRGNKREKQEKREHPKVDTSLLPETG